jgi:3-oxoacyl-[acyl-carrier protein] reductase
MKILSGKTIVVTGAANGIGRAIATECAKNGADVVVNYRRQDAESKQLVLTLAEQLSEQYQVRVHPKYFDVREKSSIEHALHEMFRDRLDIDGWVNNAAINRPGLLLTQSDSDIREQFDTNVLGTIFCCQGILPHMLEAKKGSIVNIGSITSRFVSQGQSIYAATKGAVASLTKALAKEYGRKGIRVNCVEPGPIDTEMFKTSKAVKGAEIAARVALGRIGEAEEVAQAVVYLLSDQASFINGEVLTVDGGYSLG